jgi:hypothetical protein
MISRQTIGFSLRRLSLALIFVFLFTAFFALIPLQPLTPAWQLRISELLLTTAPFTLLGAALMLLSERYTSTPNKSWLSAKQIRQIARPAGIGFLLLIPLILNALWSQIRTADFEAQRTIRSVEARLQTVRTVASTADLVALSAGLPNDWQPIANAPLAANRARLLNRIESELARLRTVADERKQQAIQLSLKEGLSKVLLALIYAWALAGLRLPQGLAGSLEDYELGAEAIRDKK